MTEPNPLEATYRPRDYISYSTLMSFIRCPRKYFYSKCGITPKDESPALLFGSAMHKALPLAMTKGIEPAVAAFRSVWDVSLGDAKHNDRRAVAMISHFAHERGQGRAIYELLPPPTNVHLPVGEDVGEYEIPFFIDVGVRVPIFGRIDAWCRHRDTGELWAWELKTMSRFQPAVFDSLEFNPQCLTYTLVCRTLSGKPLRGVMFEAVLKDPIKVANQTVPVDVPGHQVSRIALWLRYYAEQLLACEDLALRYTAEGLDPAQAFVQNFGGCSAYPMFYQAGSTCDFVNLCRPRDWHALLPYYDIKPEHIPVELTIDGRGSGGPPPSAFPPNPSEDLPQASG